MQILQLDEFLRSIKQNIDTPHSLLLGAGASIESGIPSAADCIWDWKREIYLSQNPGAIGNFDNSKSEAVRRVIQRWIDSQNIYPAENSAEEYSYFAEKAYPIADNLKCFALNERCTQVDGYPVRRGMCFPIDKNTMYLFTHGIAPSVISPKRKYFQGGKSVPLPLKVVKHYGSGDMAQIATEILGLSKMNWNSFGLYSKLPCTIESSNEIARIGWLLSQFEGTLYDYRYFM